jgi:hypothetical protein
MGNSLPHARDLVGRHVAGLVLARGPELELVVGSQAHGFAVAAAREVLFGERAVDQVRELVHLFEQGASSFQEVGIHVIYDYR